MRVLLNDIQLLEKNGEIEVLILFRKDLREGKEILLNAVSDSGMRVTKNARIVKITCNFSSNAVETYQNVVLESC